MRRDYQQFVAREAEVLCIAPEDLPAVRAFWAEQDIPFVGLADPHHAVAKLYGQEVSLLRLGRMPALMLIDKLGRIRYRHHAVSMADIPSNESVLAVLDILNGEEELSGAQASGVRGDSPLP